VASACATTSDAPPPPERAALESEARAAHETPTTSDARLVGVTADIAVDDEVAALLAPHEEAVSARAKRVVGTLTGPLDRGARDDVETTLGNFASDALRGQMPAHVGRRVDVCFQNMGGLRRNLDAGPVTEGDLVEVMPFDNTVVVFELDGASLQALLDRVAERRDPISGVRYRREGNGAKDVTVEGAPLDRARPYVVCTNDYVFEGGGDYPLHPAKNVVHTGVLVRDVFADAIEAAEETSGGLAPVKDGRVTE